jgi:outer membrane protein
VKRSIVQTIVLFLFIPLFLGSAQALKVGYVDSQKIFEGLPEAQEAKKKLDETAKAWQDEMEKMGKDLQAQYEDYQAKQATMTDAAKKQKEQDLMKLQNQIAEYRQTKFGQGGDLAKEQKKALEPIQNKVLKAIGEIAREDKLNFMFDKLQDVSVILYAEEKFDYTFKVLDKLKRGAGK